jgi:ribosomal protein S18 acetylase RimI-like enzyme
MTVLDEKVWAAHGDAWQSEGRLRARLGGGAADWRGIRLMASGLPHAKWNNGDVSDPHRVDWPRVRHWYATRADGAGVPWGVRVPATTRFAQGQFLFLKRCMALLPEQLRAAAVPRHVSIRVATMADADTVARVDAGAFHDPLEQVRPWIEPHLGATGFEVAIASHESRVVGTGTAIATHGVAGPTVGIFGVAVLPEAQGRGIGSALTSWLLQRAFAVGANFAHLNPDSDAAQRLYARLGFVQTAGLNIFTDL